MKESPLLSSLSSSAESVRLLKLCTVRVADIVVLGPWIKKALMVC